MSCGQTPAMVHASGTDPVTIKVECCGKSETRVVSKKELTFTQRFFEEEESNDE